MKSFKVVAIAAAVFAAMQLVPYGRDHTNPPVLAEPEWDSPETRAAFFRACRDCHSNETVWPWYSSIAPVSWLVRYDVEEGRSHLNVSQWGHGKQHGDEAAEMVREEEMPPWFYLPLHADAALTASEREAFLTGLERTFPEKPEANQGHGSHDH
jgi:hypothetical protein